MKALIYDQLGVSDKAALFARGTNLKDKDKKSLSSLGWVDGEFVDIATRVVGGAFNLPKRLNNDYNTFKKNPPFGCWIGPVDEEMMIWEGKLLGPRETPYEGGTFEIEMRIPKDYPF